MYLPGGNVQAIESRPRIEGGTVAYLAVDGARKEIQLGFYPDGGGDRNWLHLSMPAGVVAYASESAETPLTDRTWDDYDLGNWGVHPASIWVETTTSGQKTVSLDYKMGNWIVDGYSDATHTATVTLNCVKADLYLPGLPYTDEEEPGAYLGVTKSLNLYLDVTGSALNDEGTVTLTWTNSDKVVVQDGATGTVVSSARSGTCRIVLPM